MPYGTYSVWRLNDDGTAIWVDSNLSGSSAEEVLNSRVTSYSASYYKEGGRYIVLNPAANPNGAQVLFTLKKVESPLQAAPIGVAR